MGIVDRIKGAVSAATKVPSNVAKKVEETRERIEEVELREQNKRETEASAARLQKEKEIRAKQASGTISPEMAEERRKRAVEKYESDKKSTVEKVKTAVINPLFEARERNIQRQQQPTKQGKPLTRAEVERIARGAQSGRGKKTGGGAMAGGQFHAPHVGKSGFTSGWNMGSAFDFGGFGGTHGKKKPGKKLQFDDWYKF